MKNILHISDIHVCEAPMAGMSEQSLKSLTLTLTQDLKTLPTIDTILITGDIANSGQASEYLIFQNYFLTPLLNEFGLEESRVFIVPGNHDSNRKEWKMSDTLARSSLIGDKQQSSIKEFFQEKINDPNCNWSSNFLAFRDALDANNKNIILSNKFFAAYSVDGIGIGCLNSAWLSNKNDKESLLVSEWQFQEIFKALKSFDTKIILMHHPLDWLANDDKRNLANSIHTSKISSLFYGHMHEFMMIKESQFSEDSVLKLQSGRLDTSKKEQYCGYSLIALHENNTFDSGEIYFRKFDPKKNVFRSWTERTDNGKSTFSLIDTQPFDPEHFSSCCKKLINEIEYDLLCNTGLSTDQQRKLSDIFILPLLAAENDTGITENSFNPKQQASLTSQFQTLQSLTNTSNSLIILGSENSGKSTLANRLILLYLENQAAQSLDKVVFYLDLKDKTFKNTRRIESELLSFYVKEGNEPTFQEKIAKKLNSQSAVIIFDSIEQIEPHSLKIVFEYIETSPARVIIFGQLSARPVLREITSKIILQEKFKYFSLRSLKRSHLKELASKWKPTTPTTQTNKLTSSALKAISGAGMASNPFVFSMLLSIRERKSGTNKTYMHEADLVENFIEIIMQKHVIPVGNVPQYKDLLLFLGYVADTMQKASNYTVSENDLLLHALNFNKVIAQNFDAICFIDPITKSGVMKKFNGSGYRFSQICFFNYALAYWISKQDFNYETLDRELNFSRFDKAVEYVSALKSDLKLLDYLSLKLDKIWGELVNSNGLHDLESAELEVIKCANHDILDLIKQDALESTFIHHKPNEREFDDSLDENAPLSDEPITEINDSGEATSVVASFHEVLSLYGRAFRAAEHILNPHATLKHLENIFKNYMRSIAFSVRSFDKTGRPAFISYITSTLEYEKIEEGKRGGVEAQVNAFINFLIATIPNWGVSMMSSDCFNQRQRTRIETLRSNSTNNLEKLLLTYCLCELDDVNIHDELKAQKYERPHESSSLILKLIELIFFNFSISENDKEKLKAYATKMIKDRKTNQLFRNYTVVSKKLGKDMGIS